MIDKPGKYNISFEEYLADPCVEPSLTRSTIKSLISETPRKAFMQHPRLNKDCVKEQAEKFDIGTAAHSVFLNGEDCICVIDPSDYPNKKGGIPEGWTNDAIRAARDEARKAGKTPLLAGQYADVLAMVMAARKALAEWEDGRGVSIEDGFSELTFVWQEKNGVWCRIRPDWISDRIGNVVIDYKTTGESADPQSYNRIAINNGLDIQEAFYRRGVKAVDGYEPDFVFLVQEVEPPYDCAFVRLDMMTRDMGEQKVDLGIDLFGQYLSSGIWPGYGNKTFTMEAPAYALAAWEMRKFSIGIANQGEI